MDTVYMYCTNNSRRNPRSDAVSSLVLAAATLTARRLFMVGPVEVRGRELVCRIYMTDNTLPDHLESRDNRILISSLVISGDFVNALLNSYILGRHGQDTSLSSD